MEQERATKLYKAVYEEYKNNPLSSRSEKGRFHDQVTGRSTTYLAASRDTAWKEVTHRWRAAKASYLMVEVMVNVKKVVDLTDPSTQARYGVDAELLTAEEHEPCRQIAARLRAEGVEAIWTFSAADKPEGRQLVLFLDRLGPGSYVRIHRVRRSGGSKE